MVFPELQTDRTVLRQFQKSDINYVYQGLSDPEIIRYYEVSYTSLEHTKEQMQWFSSLEKEGAGIWWAIWDKKEHRFLGAAGFNDMHKEHKKAEIGFWLLQENWGKGIIPEVVPKLLDYVFNTRKFHRIEAYVESENENSKKALSKLNFQFEGCMRESEYKNGKFIDVEIYAILNTDGNTK